MSSKEKLFHVGVKGLITNNEGKLLILKVNTSTFKNKTVHWDIPGGRIQEGQSAIDTLRREVMEETDLEIDRQPTFFTAVISNIEIPLPENEIVGLVLMIYRVSIPVGSEIHLSDEHTAFEWVDPMVAADRLSHKYPPDFTQKLVRLIAT